MVEAARTVTAAREIEVSQGAWAVMLSPFSLVESVIRIIFSEFGIILS
jgi:hypothetical protein